MPDKTLILLTDSFPFGSKETFLESEMVFLASRFSSIHIFPLHGTESCRPQASHVTVHEPFLSFHAKDQRKLLAAGLFNRSPIAFICREFLLKSVYKHPKQIRVWLAALLVFRAAFANKERLSELSSLLHEKSIVYSYWGDKLAVLIPFLRKTTPSFTSVVRFHRTDLYEEFKHGYIPFRSVLFPSIDHFVFISEDGKRYLTRKYLQWVHNQHLFRLGVPDQGVNPQGTTDMLHLVSCSYMVPVKRIPLLIEALMRLDIPVKWTHIGSGSQWEEINRLIKELPRNVEAKLKGGLTNSEVINYYKQTPIDLFINVSESEGVPVSIMEALSFGIPVIATDAGGTGEIVDNTVGCLLPVATNAPDIASAIKNFYMLTDKEALRQNARKRWLERCDAEQNYTAFAEFLQNLTD
jgi:colanic acid/amylovoran biosynthesis glycosyltransferase